MNNYSTCIPRWALIFVWTLWTVDAVSVSGSVSCPHDDTKRSVLGGNWKDALLDPDDSKKVVGAERYKTRRRYTDNIRPVECYNVVVNTKYTNASDSTASRTFLCPRWDQEDSYKCCCGKSDSQICCTLGQRWKEGVSTWKTIVSIVVVVVVIFAAIAVFIYHHKRKRAARAQLLRSGAPQPGAAPAAVPGTNVPSQQPQPAGYPTQPSPPAGADYPREPAPPPGAVPGYPTQQPFGYQPQAPGYPAPQQPHGYPPQQAPGYQQPQQAPAYPAPYQPPPQAPGYPAPQQAPGYQPQHAPAYAAPQQPPSHPPQQTTDSEPPYQDPPPKFAETKTQE